MSQITAQGYSSKGQYLQALNFLKRVSTDPTGLLRHNGAGIRNDMFQDIPSLPAVALYGFHHEWTFNNDNDTDTTNVWAQVRDAAGTSLTVQDERGGVAKFTNAAGDNDHHYYMSKYEIAQVVSGKDLWFRGKVKIADVDQADWFFGLSARLSAADALFDARVNAVGFYGLDGSANINCESKATTAETTTTTGKTLTDATFEELSFHVVSNTTVEFFINDVYVATHRTYIPSTEMCVAFGCRNGQASANSMSLSRITLTMPE